ncbi:TPA: amidophosphoribosyltransferase [Candidatus Micrarchaeota archaeon]|nr:amidophosphoribosyltransferase [Candidatus Micrarchaeota archaeon]
MAVEVNSTCITEEKGEECGIAAIISKTGKDVAPLMYRALFALQHRGQDAAGFAVWDGGKVEVRKGIGLVPEIFKPEDLQVKGSIGIGHTRYPTIGGCREEDVQPSVFGDIAVAHNGHVANYDELKAGLEKAGYKYVSTVDSEPMVYVIDRNKDLEKGAKEIIETFEGAFSDVCIYNGMLAVFRDRFSLRPLIWGENDDFICFASETVALDINGIPYKGEVKGGSLVTIKNNKMESRQLVENAPRHCMFEYVYFSRPDSIINGDSVYAVRVKLGEGLAKEHPVDADVVIPVPDTARTAAAAFGRAAGMEVREGLIKNRYIGRTFIMPSQEKRREAVKLKLNPVKEVVGGKRVVLVDDSIVRGTTLREIVALVRSAGAKEVHLRITSPPIKAPCFYGVDMSTFKELIANNKTVEQTAEYLGADSLGYLSIGGLKEAIGVPICTGCLNEEYHTDFVRKLAESRKEE